MATTGDKAKAGGAAIGSTLLALFFVMKIVNSCSSSNESEKVARMAAALNASDLLSSAQRHADAGESAAVFADCSKLLSLKDVPPRTNTLARLIRGSASFDLGAYQAAISDFDVAIEGSASFGPESANTALYCRATAFIRTNRHKEAIADLDRLVQRNDATPERMQKAYLLRALANEKLGFLDQSIADSTRVIEAAGVSKSIEGTALASRGWYEYRLGSLDQSINDSRRALELNPKAASAAYNIGTVFLRQSKFQEAAEAYESALALRSPLGSDGVEDDLIELRDKLHGPPETTAFLGWIYLEAGQTEKGVTQLQAYLRESPQGPRSQWAKHLIAEPPVVRMWKAQKAV